MNKFLRRYSKWILAVFGSLLLVVFLAPTAVQEFADARARGSLVWASVGPEAEELGPDVQLEAATELNILEPLIRPLPFLGEIREPEHWYLLVREARMAGLVPTRGSIEMDPQIAEQLFVRVGRNQRTERALAGLQGVLRLIDRWQRGATMSDRRMQASARELFHELSARVMAIESDPETAPMPEESAILAHYEAYRDIEPGAGEGPGRFGYRLPNRFTIELLHVPAEAIDRLVEAEGSLEERALTRHWVRNAESRGFPPFELGAEVPDVVRTDLLEELESARRDAIEKWIVGRQLELTRGLASDELGFSVLPEDWPARRLDLASLVERLPEEFPGLDGVRYLREDAGMLRLGDLAEDRFVPSATTDRYGAAQGLASLVAVAREFGGDGRVPVQAGLAGPILRTPEGGIVVFRILEADAARAPRDLAEVREEVVTDLRRLAAWDRLLQEQETIERDAETRGLLAVSLDRGTDLEQVGSIARVSPGIFQATGGDPRFVGFTTLPGVGRDAETTQRIIDYAMELPMDRSAATLPSDQRIASFAADSALTLLLVELTRQSPLDRETFEQLSSFPTLLQLVNQESFEQDLGGFRESFGYEALAARHQFVPRRRSGDADPDADTEPAGAEESAPESASAAATP
ncbi:MAG: hypothetical protein ACYTEV_00865 [Planctomycetota bacterium]|jgi:hypothetical protein